ncbi:MAG: peptide ABC transporter permease, partial [Bdellovibrionales bacterium]|nr:peptide ABC transporter permease [Bdellovibrionales bacterium]
MIESLIKNDLTLKRYRRFKRRKLAVISVFLLLTSIIMTFVAPMIANSKPLYLNYKGKSFYPAFLNYHPKEFQIYDSMSVDYRQLKIDKSDSVVWPLIKWDPFESNEVVDSYPSPPDENNILGTDDRGRDVLTRLLYGFKYSIVYAFLVWAITFFLGTVAGSLM